MRLKAINFVVFQAAWLLAVLGAARGWWWAAPAGAAAAVVVHVYVLAPSRRELAFIIGTALVGTTADAGLIIADIVRLAHPGFTPPTTVLWFASLWIIFATTLNASLGWMRGRPVVATMFGLVGGPLAYLAGQRLGAVEFSDRPVAMLVLAVEWALLTPVAMWACVRLVPARAVKA